MNKLVCPFCQKDLEEETFFGGRVFVSCNNPNCIISDWGGCSKQIITELIRTRKALGVAKERLKNIILDVEVLATPEYLASRAKETLDQIKQITRTNE